MARDELLQPEEHGVAVHRLQRLVGKQLHVGLQDVGAGSEAAHLGAMPDDTAFRRQFEIGVRGGDQGLGAARQFLRQGLARRGVPCLFVGA